MIIYDASMRSFRSKHFLKFVVASDKRKESLSFAVFNETFNVWGCFCCLFLFLKRRIMCAHGQTYIT